MLLHFLYAAHRHAYILTHERQSARNRVFLVILLNKVVTDILSRFSVYYAVKSTFLVFSTTVLIHLHNFWFAAWTVALRGRCCLRPTAPGAFMGHRTYWANITVRTNYGQTSLVADYVTLPWRFRWNLPTPRGIGIWDTRGICRRWLYSPGEIWLPHLRIVVSI